MILGFDISDDDGVYQEEGSSIAIRWDNNLSRDIGSGHCLIQAGRLQAIGKQYIHP